MNSLSQSHENWTYRYEVTVVLVCADSHHDYFNNRELKNRHMLGFYQSKQKHNKRTEEKQNIYMYKLPFIYLWELCCSLAILTTMFLLITGCATDPKTRNIYKTKEVATHPHNVRPHVHC